MHGVFSNRDLASTSSRQPRAEAIVYNVLGVSWTTLISGLEKGFSFLLRYEVALSVQMIYILKK